MIIGKLILADEKISKAGNQGTNKGCNSIAGEIIH